MMRKKTERTEFFVYFIIITPYNIKKTLKKRRTVGGGSDSDQIERDFSSLSAGYTWATGWPSPVCHDTVPARHVA